MDAYVFWNVAAAVVIVGLLLTMTAIELLSHTEKAITRCPRCGSEGRVLGVTGNGRWFYCGCGVEPWHEFAGHTLAEPKKVVAS